MPNGTGDGSNIPKHLMELNTTLVKTLVEQVTEALNHINESLENQGKIDKEILERLVSLNISIENVLENAKEISPDVIEAVSGINQFLVEKPFHDEDKENVMVFVRRLSATVSMWSPKERTEILEVLEDFPEVVIKVKKRLRKIYLVLGAAGLSTILASVGAPGWIKQLIQIFFGG